MNMCQNVKYVDDMWSYLPQESSKIVLVFHFGHYIYIDSYVTSKTWPPIDFFMINLPFIFLYLDDMR